MTKTTVKALKDGTLEVRTADPETRFLFSYIDPDDLIRAAEELRRYQGKEVKVYEAVVIPSDELDNLVFALGYYAWGNWDKGEWAQEVLDYLRRRKNAKSKE